MSFYNTTPFAVGVKVLLCTLHCIHITWPVVFCQCHSLAACHIRITNHRWPTCVYILDNKWHPLCRQRGALSLQNQLNPRNNFLEFLQSKELSKTVYFMLCSFYWNEKRITRKWLQEGDTRRFEKKIMMKNSILLIMLTSRRPIQIIHGCQRINTLFFYIFKWKLLRSTALSKSQIKSLR